jgi:hypothetical protein
MATSAAAVSSPAAAVAPSACAAARRGFVTFGGAARTPALRFGRGFSGEFLVPAL